MMKLIDEARKWYRMFSVQALIFIGAVQGIAMAVPAATLAGRVPFMGEFTWNDLNVALTITAAALGAVGRLIDQGSATTVTQ
jgi:hypothetical protein